jgi:hypothetical protein
MQLDFVTFALENGFTTLPTGENTLDMLKRIVTAMRGEEPVRRGRRRKEPEEQTVA